MLKIALCAIVLVEAFASPSSAWAASVVVPAHTQLILVPERAFLASDLKAGHEFDLTIQDPIIADGYVAIPDGARARAHVISSGPALRIVFDWIQTPGKKIGLDPTPYEVQARGTDGKRHRFFFGLFRKRAAMLPKLAEEFPLEALTQRRVHVATSVRATRAQRNAALRKLME